MRIDRINYQETFNLGNYCSQRIGVEIEINEGEDAKAALETARQLVHEFHSQTSPTQDFMGTQVRSIEQDNTEREDTIKQEYMEVEAKLNSIEFQEDAIEYLNTTTFKHFIPAKTIANSKPNKK